MKKKILACGVAVAMCATMAVGLVGCGKSPKPTTVDSKEVYAMSAVSGASFLSSQGKVVPASTNFNSNNFVKTVAETKLMNKAEVPAEHLSTIDTYLNMFDSMLEGGLQETPGTVAPEDEAHQEYKFKLTIKVGNDEYTMFYNEKDTKTNESIKENETETESETTLKGIIDYKGETFNLTGKKEFKAETEGDESETESSITFTVEKDQNNYVTVTQGFELETENGKEEKEITYEYKTVVDGVSKVTEIEFENEEAKRELEIKFKDTAKTKYKITNEASGFKAIVNKDAAKTFDVSIVEGVTTFTFADGTLTYKDGQPYEKI